MWQVSPCQLTRGEYRLRTEEVLSVLGAGSQAEGPQTIIIETRLGSLSPGTTRRSVMWQTQVQRRRVKVREVKRNPPRWEDVNVSPGEAQTQGLAEGTGRQRGSGSVRADWAS